MTRSLWDRRIRRAEELAGSYRFAGDMLRFYGQLATLQKSIYEALQRAPRTNTDPSALLPHLPALLSLVKGAGPEALAGVAQSLAGEREGWPALLEHARNPDVDHRLRFFARALLQPFWESLALQAARTQAGTPRSCPFCGDRPLAGVLRGEGEGAKRSLLCSLCSTEWEYRRLLCANCGEESERKLPLYVAEEFPHIRVEACETCRTYIKSVDLTKNGLAVPEVDELAAVPLDLWASEHGYAKVEPNILGM